MQKILEILSLSRVFQYIFGDIKNNNYN